MHRRDRHVIEVMKKRAKVFPVVGLLGVRQVGKTTFLNGQWRDVRNARYVTFDRFETARRASRAPEAFILGESDDLKRQLIIDEIQKVPHLFDSLKAVVDERRRVGAFVVSGSVEFSLKSGVRESLAGRMGAYQLHPLTLREIAGQPLASPWTKPRRNGRKPLSAKNIEDWLVRGGMPTFLALRDDAERNLAISSWLEAICFRDLQQIKTANLDGELALAILRWIARRPRLNASAISRDLGIARAKTNQYMSAFEALFLVHRLSSFENPNAAPEYALCDAAVFRFLYGTGSDREAQHRSFRTLLINELRAQFEYRGLGKPVIHCYRHRGGVEIDLVLTTPDGRVIGFEISTSSDVTPYRLRSMKSFLERHPEARGIVLAPIIEAYEADGIEVLPWTVIG